MKLQTYQSAPLLVLCEGIHWWPVDSPHKGQVMQKDFPCHDVIMRWTSSMRVSENTNPTGLNQKIPPYHPTKALHIKSHQPTKVPTICPQNKIFLTRGQQCMLSYMIPVCVILSPVSIMMTSSNGNIFRVSGCTGMHRSPANSPHKGQWRRALMFSLICAWITVE